MSQCVLEEQVVMDRANEKVVRNTNLLNASVAMCEAFEEEYETATESRNEEIELLGVVRNMVNRRLSGVAQSIVDRDDGFQAYSGPQYQEEEFDHAAAGKIGRAHV